MRFIAIATCVLLLSSAVARGDSTPPRPEPIGSSHDGHFIVRLGSRIQVFALAPDEKSYRRVAEFSTGTEVSPLMALITNDGRFVITLDGGFGMGRGRHVVAVYEAGRKLKEWSLAEILTKEDLDTVPSTVSSTWWRKEVVVLDPQRQLAITGPYDQLGPVPSTRRYWYQLDLETLKWTKR